MAFKIYFMNKYLLFFLCFYVAQAQAQVGINHTNALPDSSAMLDVSSTSKGVLIPRMTTQQRDSIVHPLTGLLIFNSTLSQFQYALRDTTFMNTVDWISIGNDFSVVPPLQLSNNASQLSLSQASNNLDGYLSSADWNTFNNKQEAIGNASATTNGILSSTDWNTFNNKSSFTLPILNNGSVLFSNGSTIDQNNSHYFWNNTNGHLGIGTNSPNRTLTVNSSNNGSGYMDWIAGNFGGHSGDRVVIGLGNGMATIGAHNNALSAWDTLNLGGVGKVKIESLSGSGNRYVTTDHDGNINAMPLNDATAFNTGLLSSTDWNTFNNKQNALSNASTSTHGILTSTDWNTFNNKQNALSNASTSTNGILTSTDWNTFNNKSNFTLPSLASGSVLFSNGISIDQNNTKYFWNNTNGHLGIGTNSPNRTLTVNSTNPGTGTTDWIAGNFGGIAGNRVILGLLNGEAVIGAHNNSLSSWATLNLGGDGPVKMGSLIGNGSRMVVADPSGNLSTQAIPQADHLGNHTASQNINLNGKLLTGGGLNGLTVDAVGKVAIGTPSPWGLFDVRGTSGAVIDQSTLNFNSSAIPASPGSTPTFWQSFTPSNGGYLTLIKARFNWMHTANGPNPEPATLLIYNGEGISGTLLHSQAIGIIGGGHAGGGTVYVTNDFVLSQPVPVSSGQKYTFYIVPATPPSLNWVDVNYTQTYSGGQSSLGPNVNLRFEVYTNPIIPGLTVMPSGLVGIGTLLPAEKLHVEGNGYLTGSLTTGANLQCNGTFTSIGAVSFCNGAYTCSDRRYKKDITQISNSLKNIMTLNGYTYNWRKTEFPEKQFTDQKQIGFIAQELEILYPEMVTTDSATGYKSVDYAKITPVLLEAIKELKTQMDLQKQLQQQQIDELKKQMKILMDNINYKKI
jgi:hypothetical protein